MYLDYLNVVREAKEPTVYRVSSIRDFNKCSYLYKLKNIDKLDSISFSEATITGNLCHDALEAYYLDWKETKKEGLVLHYLINTYKKTLVDIGVVPKNIDSDRKEALFNNLLDYTLDTLSLYIRASENYKGNNPIRTKDGKIPAAPKSTTAWNKSLEILNLRINSNQIDEEAVALNPKLAEMSLSSAMAEAAAIILSYKKPKEEVDVISLEFSISHWDYKSNSLINPFRFPKEFNGGNESDLYIKGSIDKVAVLNYKGEEKIAVLDYKSSKADKDLVHVQHDVQLYNYVYCFEQLTGLTVSLIGIQNLRSNTLSLVEVDREIMMDCLKNFFFKHYLIQANFYHKEHTPDSIYSPCLNMFSKPCPFLEHCYPKAYNSLYQSKPGEDYSSFNFDFNNFSIN